MTAVKTKTQHQSGDASSTKFAVGSKVHWDEGEQYFCIKSRDSVVVSSSATADKVLDFKSHEYSVGSSQDGCYDVVLMDSAGDSSSHFFAALL